MSWLLTLLGCSWLNPQETPIDPGDAAKASCVAQACAEASDAAACEVERCALRDATWGLQPTRIQADGATGTVFVEARVAHTPAAFGTVPIERDDPVYVGVTVVTTAGEEIDLAVQTRFPGDLEAPFMFSADVEAEVRDVLFGVWDLKIEPCDVDRSGCKDFGFVLDGSLASWPPRLYVDGQRQRIPPATLALRIDDAGLPGKAAHAARDAAAAALAKELARFDVTPEVAPLALAAMPSAATRVAHGNDHDGLLAEAVAAGLAPVLGGVPEVSHVPELGDAIVVTLGAPDGDTRHACAVDRCDALDGDALGACLDANCS